MQRRELPQQVVLELGRLRGIGDAEEIRRARDLLHQHGRVRCGKPVDLRNPDLGALERAHDGDFALQRKDRARQRPGAGIDAQEGRADARRALGLERIAESRCAARDALAGSDVATERGGRPRQELRREPARAEILAHASPRGLIRFGRIRYHNPSGLP